MGIERLLLRAKLAQNASNSSSGGAATAKATSATPVVTPSASGNKQIANLYEHLLNGANKDIVNNVPQNAFSSFDSWYKAATTPSAKTTLTDRGRDKKDKDDDGFDLERPTYQNYSFAPSENYLKAMEYTNSLLEQLSSGRTSYTDQINALMDQINNREAFSYDPNNDTLFQNYLASMQMAGANAMQDTIGQASALTGGYGSTYATSAGNQAYNNYIQGAYDNLPEYYEASLGAYNAEGDAMYNKLGMYQTADDIEYNRLASAYSANAQAAAQMYDNEYNNYWNSASMANENYWKQKSPDYQKERDAVSDSQWQQQMMASLSKKSAGTDKEYKEPTASQYQNALKAAQSGNVKEFQMLVDSYGSDIDNDAMVKYLLDNGVPASFFDSYSLTKATPNLIGNNNNNVISRKDKDGKVIEEKTVKEFYKQLIEEGFSEDAAKLYIEQMGYNATKLK